MPMFPKQTEHRFTKLARRVAADLWEGVKLSLSTLTHESTQLWTAERLMRFLEGAEDLAREALRTVAAKLHVFERAVPERKRARPAATPSSDRTVLFKLGVDAAPQSINAGKTIPGNNSEQTQRARAYPSRQAGEDRAARRLENRLSALQDVFDHPGKHAARMARALHRESCETAGKRLTLKDDDDILLDHAGRLANNPAQFYRVARTAPSNWAIDTS